MLRGCGLIRVRILGSAAGGGLPQWNCSCANCASARAGDISPQTQSSVALTADGRRWFLINASPDLPAQIEAFPALHPVADSPRNSPIEAVLLTNADLDHSLGLLLLRQGGRIHVHAPDAVRDKLSAFESLLARFGGIEWHAPPAEFTPLRDRNSEPSGLSYRAIFSEDEATVAYQFLDETTAKTVLIAPAVATIDAALRAAIGESDAILLDGTFWSNEELRAVKPDARTAREMGHLPIIEGSLDVLRAAPAATKMYFHINNTNPILANGSAEQAAAHDAGIAVARDGMEFTL